MRVQIRRMRWFGGTTRLNDDTRRHGTFVCEHLWCCLAARLSRLSSYTTQPPRCTRAVSRRRRSRQ